MDTSILKDDEIIDMYNKVTEFITNLEKSKINEEKNS